MDNVWTKRRAYYFEGAYDETVILRKQAGKWYLEGNYNTSLYNISELACCILNGQCEGVQEEINELVVLVYENANHTSKIALEKTCTKGITIHDILEVITKLIWYPSENENVNDSMELRLEKEGGERWWIYPDRRTRYEIVEFAVKAMKEKEINEIYVYPRAARLENDSFEKCLEEYSKSIIVGACHERRFDRLGTLDVK